MLLFVRLIKIPFAILVSVIVGVTNLIPFFGPIVGAVPCLMILLIVDPFSALRFFILIVALQQFDGNILGPKILGDSTGLSPLLVLAAIVGRRRALWLFGYGAGRAGLRRALFHTAGCDGPQAAPAGSG